MYRTDWWRQLYNWWQFRLERLLLRGAHWRLLVIAGAIGLISMSGGATLILLDAGPEALHDAVWWAFLRLSDPGYLGDDEGAARRVISTILTVLGYVFFMGALVAIMTQWLHATINRLERGETPIAMKRHLLILGYTDRTPIVLQELLTSGSRLHRFLRLRGARRLTIVVLADEVTARLRADVKQRLGVLWDDSDIVLRSGSRLRVDHLERVGFLDASAILVPANYDHEADPHEHDAATIKTLLSITNHPRAAQVEVMPRVVAEFFDANAAALARAAYGDAVELLPSDRFSSRILAQNIRHRGLSFVLSDLLNRHEGSEVLIREIPRLHGLTFHHAAAAFDEAILLGVVREREDAPVALLNPPADFLAQKGDRFVLIGREGSSSEPLRTPEADVELERCHVSHVKKELSRPRRVLLLGWRHKVPTLLQELATYEEETFIVDIFSRVSAATREREIVEHGAALDRVAIRHFEGDYTVPTDLARLDLESYDNVVFLGRSRAGSRQASDSQTIMGLLLLERMLEERATRPAILVELADAQNLALIRDRSGEILVTSRVLSHLLAHVTLRPELLAVYEELFSVGGAELFFRPASHYGLSGRDATFGDIQNEAFRRGETAIGLRVADGSVHGRILINPSRAQTWTLHEDDCILVVSTY